MFKSIADGIQDDARRKTLLRLLRLRFECLPKEIADTIHATQNSEQLDSWLDAFAVAEKLSDIDFGLDK